MSGLLLVGSVLCSPVHAALLGSYGFDGTLAGNTDPGANASIAVVDPVFTLTASVLTWDSADANNVKDGSPLVEFTITPDDGMQLTFEDFRVAGSRNPNFNLSQGDVTYFVDATIDGVQTDLGSVTITQTVSAVLGNIGFRRLYLLQSGSLRDRSG